MKNFSRILVLLAAACFVTVGTTALAQESDQSFGAGVTLERTVAVDVSRVVTTTELQGPTLLVEGEIADVCTRKGCWLVVSDGKKEMRVTFKDYGFFVPKDSKGRRVLLQGVVERKEISEEEARHYAEEGTSGPKPEEIKGPQTVVTMVATGVVILAQ